MRKLLLAAGGLVVVFVLLGLAYGAWLLHSLGTPAFRDAMLQRLKAATGSDVRVQRLEVSLLSGVTLQGITIANPPPFRGDLLAADELALRYRLWSLLGGDLELTRLSLERPRIALVMDARGVFNYERLGRGATAPPGGTATTSPARALPLHIVLSRLAVDGASVTVSDQTRARLVSLDGASLETALDLAGGRATGSGKARIETLNLGGRLLVRDVRSPLRLASDSLVFEPIGGRLAGGEAGGKATVRFKNGLRYAAELQLSGVKMRTLLQEAGSAAAVEGSLGAEAHFEGTGGLATMRGRGQGRISECRIADNRTLQLLSSLLDVPELADPQLDECRAEFTQAGYEVATPVLRLTGKTIQLNGRGRLRLDTNALDYEMTLALAPALFAKMTRKELRPAFQTRADGFATIDFKLSGTTLAPRTDLMARIGKGVVQQTFKSRLKKLFGGK